MNDFDAHCRNVTEIDTRTARAFCEQHHLQNYAASSVKLGAWLNTELIAVMTFKLRTPLVYELSRYCVHPDYSAVGVAHKLLARFVRTHRYDLIYTFSDNRYFRGNLYESLNFEFAGETSPNYWYIINNYRKHRLCYTKQRLVASGHDPALTEWEIMKSMGRDRIWDCGNKKWVLHNRR